jgi:ABC-type transport system substrate-binding protein
MKKIRNLIMLGIIFISLLSVNINPQIVITEPKSGKDEFTTLIVGTTGLGLELDPAFAWDSYSIDIISQVWEGLYAYDLGTEQLDMIPRLAADPGIWNAEGDVFNVTLRSGVTFHNGQEFNASSVKYTFDRLWELCVYQNDQVRDLYFPFGFNTTEMNYTVGYGYLINETIIVDNTHVSFKLNFPYIPFKSLLCFSASFIVDSTTTEIDTYIDFPDVILGRAIGTGPYKITFHDEFNFANFEAYNSYYRGVAPIRNMIFVKYSTSTDISLALLAGDIDFPISINADLMNEFNENLMTIIEEPKEIFTLSYLGMNTELINRDFRHAINYAIDYDYIINEIYDNRKTQMTSVIPTNMLYHKDCAVPYFDVWNARQILIDSGNSGPLNEFSTDQDWIDVAHSTSPLLEVNYQFNDGNYDRFNIGILMINNLEKIGIKVYLESLLWGDFLNKLYNTPEELGIFAIGWMADYNDPSNFINPLFSNTSMSNAAQVNDPWLQEKMSDGLMESNELIRETIYHDIQDYIATDLMPWAFLGYSLEMGVHTAHLENFQYNAMSWVSFFDCSWAEDVTDSDGDNIPDFYENYQYGTDPYEWDTDFDNIGDWDEIYTYYTNPNERDTDFDNLGDWEEIYDIGTDPTDWDTDDDGLSDGAEILEHNTDPFNWDCDDDGLSDGDEIINYNTDPNNWDTDYDGFSDKDEINAGSDPNDYDSTPENVDQVSDPFANIPGFPVAFLLSILIFISFGLVFFMKKQL